MDFDFDFDFDSDGAGAGAGAHEAGGAHRPTSVDQQVAVEDDVD